MGSGIKRYCLVVPFLAALSIGLAWASAGAAQGPTRIPKRNTAANPTCGTQPGRPKQTQGYWFGGITYSYPIVAGIDANGCDSWAYELAPNIYVPGSFFAGSGFRSGITALEYGTRETTETISGHQLISVTNPGSQWLNVYAGYDSCKTEPTSGTASKKTCIAPALLRQADFVWAYIPVGILLALLLGFVVYNLRPAGPIPKRRHYRRRHESLAKSASSGNPSVPENIDVKQLQRRLRRLEKTISAELSESQHHWFTGSMARGRHGFALESVARWFAESGTPMPDHLRSEFLWIASSLDIEREIQPIIDAHHRQEHHGPDPESTSAVGVHVSLEDFELLVADAVDSLPEEFGRAMTNVAIVVEEEAEGQPLFGLYQGHPLTYARLRQWSIHPDKIIIYRKTICEHSSSEEQVRAQVYQTVIHEIAHHFGIGDPRLRELGW